jgi:hypothetical protein
MNSGAKMANNTFLSGLVFSLCTVAICLVLNQPAAAQTMGEAVTTMEVQQELMGSEAQKRIAEPNLNPGEKSVTEQKSMEKIVEKAPVAIKTNPQAFANDVESTLKEITVTFDQQMMDRSMSWTGGGETYPKTTGQPSYDQSRTTCTLPVALEAGMVYWVGINNASYQNFKNANGVPAKQYVILFATRGSDGKPTPIPENLLQKAKAINQNGGDPDVDKSVAGKTASEVGGSNSKDVASPDVNDFNDYKQEISRIDIEARGEESKWLGKLDRKSDLAKAMDDVVVAELKFLRKMADTEGSQKTVEAIDLILKRRQERLAKLITKLEDEAKTERRERRPLRTGGAGAGEQSQTGRSQRRAREPMQPANTNTNTEGQQQ